MYRIVDMAHRWDDDVVFKNQARGTEDKRRKEFVNVKSHAVTVAGLEKALIHSLRTCCDPISTSASW